MDNKSIDNTKHIKKVYTEKTINLLKIYIGVAIISGVSYLIGLLYGLFDFGIIFEIISVICVYISIKNLSNNNLSIGKNILL